MAATSNPSPRAAERVTIDERLHELRPECRVDGQLRLSVRNARAGCFTEEELTSARGVPWSPEEHRPREPARLDPPYQLTTRRAFGPELVQAFIDGDAFGCFGEGFEVAATHQRTPGIPGGVLKPFDEVTVFDPSGGPWGRGYLRAETTIGVDSWFYAGHFKEDPCMPGCFLSGALVNAMSFYIAALGFTIQRDAWRFEPVIDETSTFVFRGQLTPDRAHRLIYEIFVEEVVASPRPTLYASLLCSCDGQRSFTVHASVCASFRIGFLKNVARFTRQKLKCITCIPSTRCAAITCRCWRALSDRRRNGSARPTRDSMRAGASHGSRVRRYTSCRASSQSILHRGAQTGSQRGGGVSHHARGVVFPGKWSACAADLRPHGDGDAA